MNANLVSGMTPTEVVQRKTQVWLFGNFGPGNLGNEATLQATLYNLRRLMPTAEVRCICTDPEAVHASYKIPAILIRDSVLKPWTTRHPVARLVRKLILGIPCELYRWLKCFRALRGQDVLLVPGTGLLTDAYGLSHWGPYSIFKWSLAAKLSGCKVLFVSVGVGPLYTRLGKCFVKSALALADFRSFRDEYSLQYLRRIGFMRSNDRVYPDLVFSLPAPVPPHDAHAPGGNGRTVVGIGLMEYAGRLSDTTPDATIYEQYLDGMVTFVNWLVTRGYDIRLLIGDVGDAPLVQKFRQLLNQRVSMSAPGRILDVPAVSVEQLLIQLAATDLVVATRFHNVLLALLLNKPTISISFHPKCASLMDQMELTDYCQDIHDLEAERLIAQFDQLHRNADSIKHMIAGKVDACREALDEQYAVVLSHICRGTSSRTAAHGDQHRPSSIVHS